MKRFILMMLALLCAGTLIATLCTVGCEKEPDMDSVDNDLYGNTYDQTPHKKEYALLSIHPSEYQMLHTGIWGVVLSALGGNPPITWNVIRAGGTMTVGTDTRQATYYRNNQLDVSALIEAVDGSGDSFIAVVHHPKTPSTNSP